MLLLEIAELLSCLQFNSLQLQELFIALTDIATSVNKPTQQTPHKTFNLISLSILISYTSVDTSYELQWL